MSNDARGTEWKVGLFLVIGLGIIAVMAIKFGKLGQGLSKFNTITAEFPNASGLLKGANVYLAGARIGFTADAPELIEGRYAVEVILKVRTDIRIPRGSSFTIGSAGFLGDAYVSIVPPMNPNFEDALKDGEHVIGTRIEGFADLAVKGGDVMEELKKRLKELESPIKDVRERVLSDKNLKSLEKTIADLPEITTSLKGTTKGLEDVVNKAKTAADTVTETVNSAKGAIGKMDGVVKKVDDAATDLKGTLADLRKAAVSAGKALESARILLAGASAGKGTLGMLLTDKEASDNLKALIRNLKERGLLFYRDKAR
jgi:phospholipid/cholesterol/gamma-HCH transport system substrate-binding protein